MSKFLDKFFKLFKRKSLVRVVGTEVDNNTLECLTKVLETGKPVIGHVDENGKLTMEVLDDNFDSKRNSGNQKA